MFFFFFIVMLACIEVEYLSLATLNVFLFFFCVALQPLWVMAFPLLGDFAISLPKEPN